MNKVSENIIMRCKTNIRTTGCSCEADAAAIERLVQAAKKSKELIQHSNGCSLRYYTSRQVCDCGYIEVKQELNAALEAFREVSDG